MSSTTTNPTSVPSPLPSNGPTLAVPSLDELERLTSVPDERIVLRDVDWAFYEQVVDSIPEGSHIHVDYDGKDLELMSPTSLPHQVAKTLLDQLVGVVAEDLLIPYKGLGSTTWKRPKIRRGPEADECYYFKPEKLAAAAVAKARRSKDVADYKNPDLAIEVDITHSKFDRPGIYAALNVPEVWRFDGERLVIERLGEDGRYAAVEASGFLPIRAEEVVRWVVEEDSSDQSAWARRLRAWVRAELARRAPR